MNSTRCSEATTALLCIAVLLATAGTVSAFSVDSTGVPSESAVGEEVAVTYTIDDPFTDVPNEWTLHAETDLTNVSWTVTVLRAGSQVSQDTYGSQAFDQGLDIDDGGDQVQVELVGATPEVGNYSYAPAEEYTLASLSRVSGNNVDEFQNDGVHHYTEDSAAARAAIDDAEAAIDDAGGHGEAEQLVENARSAYESEDFDNAVDLAGQAESKASTAQRNTRIATAAVGLLVLVGLVGGGYHLWQSRGDDYTRL